MNRLLSVAQVAEVCGMSVTWVRRQLRQGAFSRWVRWPGGDIRIPAEDVKRFQERFLVRRERR